MQIPNWKTEEKLLKEKWDFIIGVDEAGRGPLAGPVVASAVMLKKNFQFPSNHQMEISNDDTLNKKEKKENSNLWDLVRDSKTLSEKQREQSYKFVEENFYVGVGVCNEKTIDRINILEASFLAMKSAINDLQTKNRNLKFGKCKVLVDGNKQIPNFSGEQEAIVQGDKKVKSIAAASIIAKVTRDKIMKEYDIKYPSYGFAKHKGYGTKIHMEALQKFGPCKIHRQSFKPVKRLLEIKIGKK